MANIPQFGKGSIAHQGSHGGRSVPRNQSRGRLAYTPTWSTSFTHIQTVPPQAQQEDEMNTGNSPPFIRHKSLQTEIDDSNFLQNNLLTSPSSSSTSTYCAPRSFAEAIAMPRRERGRSSRASAANGESPPQGPTPLSSFLPRVTLRYNNRSKKQKKWSPLDLATVESDSSAADSSNILISLEEPPSPTGTVLSSLGRGTPPASFAEVAAASYAIANPLSSTKTAEPFQSHQWTSPDKQVTSLAATVANKGKTRQHDSYFDPDATPTQASFTRFLDLIPTPESSEPEDQDLLFPEDSKSTKDKYETIMSRLDDAFDVLEWNPATPAGDENDSPQHLTVKHEPVTYTTVGSLAKSNETLKFTAPIRLQREGSSRRPLAGASNQVRGPESFFAGRTPTQNSFAFGSQHPMQTPLHDNQGNPNCSMPALTEAELGVLRREGLPTPQSAYNHAMNSSMTQGNLLVNDPGRSNEHLGLLNGDRAGQTPSAQSSIAGFDRMQTWQRLASYANPMQQIAKERLSGFAIGNMRAQNPANPPSVFQPAYPGPYMGQAGNNFNVRSQTTGDIPHNGTLDYNFRFPVSGCGGPSQPSSGPIQGLRYAGKAPVKESVYHQNQLPSGYPRPLTAGPPGPRPVVMGTKRSQSSVPVPIPPISQSPFQYQQGLAQPAHQRPNWEHPQYPWRNTGFGVTTQRQFTSVLGGDAKISNTAPPSDIRQYYPHGWPSDMTAEFNYLSQEEVDRDMGIESTATAEEDKQKKQDDWWYSGLRNARKGVEEHLSDGDRRDLERERGNTIAPFVSPPAFDNKGCLTVHQINKMSATESAAPLLDGLFGSIFPYADEHYNDATHKQMMSMNKFYRPPAWMIDSTEKGKKSFFGDDCGPTPKRLGRDPRYQHHN